MVTHPGLAPLDARISGEPFDACFVDLYWLPVGAGTHIQRWSLLLYEGLASCVGRRPRRILYHAALKIRLDGSMRTLELIPIPARQVEAPLMTGPVGVRAAGRLRLFRYQLLCRMAAHLPDEQWAVSSPVRLSGDSSDVCRLLTVAPSVPPHTWGQRVAGTSEMWTSDSAISWLLTKSGIDAATVQIPEGGRAPGWRAGLELAASTIEGGSALVGDARAADTGTIPGSST